MRLTKRRSRAVGLLLAGLPVAGAACGGGAASGERPRLGASIQADAEAREELAARHGWVLKRFDLNRDDQPDVFKYYRNMPDPRNPDNRLEELVRKEVDLNHDGRVDLVRLFDDRQQVTEEHADLDFDGRVDEVSYFRQGKVDRKQIDLDYDGQVDVTRYYEAGKLSRIESDRSGDGRVDTWEYFEGGELDRIGVDKDGDGEVDQWERVTWPATHET